MKKMRAGEILLAEMIIYLLLWFVNEYLATMLSLIFGSICLLILLISLIVEWIERSKVPRWYFMLMLMSVLAPLLTALLFVGINGGLTWLRE